MIRITLIAAGLFAAVLPANAAGPYDGPWSVTIITQQGSCDTAYNFQLAVENGRVISTGGTAMSGSVGRGGAVNVAISQGGSSGRASGRLAGTNGSGRWSGLLAGSKCSGRWEASKR